MISFDADPRTRLVVCCSALAALAVLGVLLLGEWWLQALLAMVAILGYFAARMDWPLYAAGIAMTPMTVAFLLSTNRPADPSSFEAATFAMYLLPVIAAIAMIVGAVGAWIGERTHGGDWRRPPLAQRDVIVSAIVGVLFGIGLVLIERRMCGGPGFEGAAACMRGNAIGFAVGAVAGALLLRSWTWPAMATAGVAVVMVGWAVIDPPGLTDALVLAANAGLVALVAVAWVRFAIEATAMLRSARIAPGRA